MPGTTDWISVSSPDGAQRNPGITRRRPRIALRSIRATAYLRAQEEASVICPSGCLLSSLISDFPKNISVPTHPKSDLELFASRPTEGRIAIVTDAGWDAVDAAAFCARRDRRVGWRKACERSTACGREMLQRTAKSCGPDAPTLASSLAEFRSARPGSDKNISAR